VRTARGARLHTLEKELAKVEYLATRRPPQVQHLQEPLRDHAELLGAGRLALAKAELRSGGV